MLNIKYIRGTNTYVLWVYLLLQSFWVVSTSRPSSGQLLVEPDLQQVSFDFPPNILWISTEDISPYLASYGDSTIQTPNLDRLANEGVLFENCFATTGQCAPSRHSIITGMHSTATSGSNMRTGGRQFPDSIRCFPFYLNDAGYYCTNNFKTDYNFSEPEHASLWDELSKSAHWKNRPAGSPFFAVFNRHETHESHINQDKPLGVESGAVTIPPYYPDTEKVRRDLARNYTNILELDSIVGDYLAEIEQAGLLDSTIIVFWSDHGGPLPRQKREIHESGTRVPMLVRLPNQQFAGTRIRNMVSLLDLGPTMLSLAGLPTPGNMHGKAFMGAFKAPAQLYVHGGYDRRAGTLDMGRYVQSDSFLYIRNYYPELPWYGFTSYRNEKCLMMEDILALRQQGKLAEPQMQWFRQTKPVEELFSVKADPHSLQNLAGVSQYRGVLLEMRQEHRRWMLQTRDIGLFPEAIQSSMEKQYGMTMYEIMRHYAIPLEQIIAVNQSWTKGKVAVPQLWQALSDTLAVNRYHAAIGLGNLALASPPITEQLKQLQRDDSEISVRLAAAYALYKTGHRDIATPVFHEGLEVGLRDNEVGYVVLSLIKRLGKEAIVFEEVVQATFAKQKEINQWNYYKELEAVLEFMHNQP